MLFSEHNPQLQLFWDSHSLSTFLTCPRKYQYKIISGLISNREALDLDFGIRYHAAMEQADKARAGGADHTEQLLVAIDQAMAEPEFIDASKEKNRFTLVRSVVWNLDYFRATPIRNLIFDGKPAVELAFSFPTEIKTSTGESFGLCGYMDGAAESDLGIVVVERKTTKNTLSQAYFDNFNPNLQISTYTAASRVIFPIPARGVMLEACQTAVNFSEFSRRIFIKTPAQVDEFYNEVRHWLVLADHYAQEQWWPKNEASCRYCEYARVCSKDPNVREQFLNDPAHFKKRVWNPLEPR